MYARLFCSMKYRSNLKIIGTIQIADAGLPLANLLMEKCFQLREEILDPQHLSTTSSLVSLNKWRLENMAIGV